MQAPAQQPTPELEPLPLVEHIVFYDGVCGLCDRLVQLLLHIDKKGVLHFAPLQGSIAVRLQEDGSIPTGVDTMLYVPRLGLGQPRPYLRSDAAIEIAKVVGGPWALARVFKIVPRALRDLGYRALAKSRYRIFGKFDACKLPSPEVKERFLE